MTIMKNIATLCADGPLLLDGEIDIRDSDDKIAKVATNVALCRCGHSKNKPYCDGSHTAAQFKDAGIFKSDTPDISTAGALIVRPAVDGPLRISGALEITCADGSTGFRGESCVLCRCGASSKKPFCDGSHRKIGFKIERSPMK